MDHMDFLLRFVSVQTLTLKKEKQPFYGFLDCDWDSHQRGLHSISLHGSSRCISKDLPSHLHANYVNNRKQKKIKKKKLSRILSSPAGDAETRKKAKCRFRNQNVSLEMIFFSP